MNGDATLPLENFIQAVQNQLDKAQTAMAVKAKNLNLPLTFAVKDIELDLRAHVEFSEAEVRIRPAGPGEKEASSFHIVFAAITRPMIEENALTMSEDEDDESLDDLQEDLTLEDRRRLEWVGVRTIKKLRELENEGTRRTIGRVTNLPASRLRKALKRATKPFVSRVTPADPKPDDPPEIRKLIRVRGRNLAQAGTLPRVTIANRPVAVLKASNQELLLLPDEEQWVGEIQITTAPEHATAMSFDLESFAPTTDALKVTQECMT